MLKKVPSLSLIEDDAFPYDFERWDYPISLLRSSLYSVWWTEIPEDSDQELALLMDYDGFVEWYNANEDAWAKDIGLDESERFTAEEYLPYHLGRTIIVVKEVTE